MEIYRFSQNSSKFELVQLNKPLSFSPEIISASEMSAQHDLIAISSQVALYIYSFINGTVEQKIKMEKFNFDAKFSWNARHLYNSEQTVVKVFTEPSFPSCG